MARRPPPPPDPKILITFRIPQSLLEAADDKAAEGGVSRNTFLIDLVRRNTRRGRRPAVSETPTAKPTIPSDVFG